MTLQVIDVAGIVNRSIRLAEITCPVKRSRTWRPEELKFIKDNLGKMSEFEISNQLPGRSRVAVHIMRKRSHLPAAIKTPGWKSANRWRDPLGLSDQRVIIGWVERGLVMGRVTEALGGRRICMVNDVSLRSFVFNPKNWVHFNPNKVRDPELKRMIEKQRLRWGDEWLTNRQAADLLAIKWGRPVTSKDVLRYIKLGRLDGQHLVNKDGRQDVNETPGWSFWMVLRSQVEKLNFLGCGEAISSWSDSADAFLVLGKAVGLSSVRIGKLMGKSHSAIELRWKRLLELDRVRELANAWGPDVSVNANIVTADWRLFRRYFHCIDKAARRFATGNPTKDDKVLLSTILRAEAIANGKDPGVKQNGSARCVSKIAKALLAQGLEPYL